MAAVARRLYLFYFLYLPSDLLEVFTLLEGPSRHIPKKTYFEVHLSFFFSGQSSHGSLAVNQSFFLFVEQLVIIRMYFFNLRFHFYVCELQI
jgi:hypothetical protein